MMVMMAGHGQLGQTRREDDEDEKHFFPNSRFLDWKKDLQNILGF